MSATQHPGMPWILASSSPRRRDILRRLGLSFETRPPVVDEAPRPDEAPAALAERLARAKAEAVSAQLAGAVVIGCDTVVAVDDRVLGKPASAAEARAMLTALSGRTHRVISGLCLIDATGGRSISGAECTEVAMRPWSDGEIEEYIASGECFGKAGAYAIQESADRFVVALRGSYDNVVGFPTDLFEEQCRALGLEWPLAEARKP